MRIASYRTKTVFFYARALKGVRHNAASVALGRTAGAGVEKILRALSVRVAGSAFLFIPPLKRLLALATAISRFQGVFIFNFVKWCSIVINRKAVPVFKTSSKQEVSLIVIRNFLKLISDKAKVINQLPRKVIGTQLKEGSYGSMGGNYLGGGSIRNLWSQYLFIIGKQRSQDAMGGIRKIFRANSSRIAKAMFTMPSNIIILLKRLLASATAISRFQGVFVYRLLWRAIGKALGPAPRTASGKFQENRLMNCLIEKGKPIVRWGRKGIGTLPEVSLPAERNGLQYSPSFAPHKRASKNAFLPIKGGKNEPLQN